MPSIISSYSIQQNDLIVSWINMLSKIDQGQEKIKIINWYLIFSTDPIDDKIESELRRISKNLSRSINLLQIKIPINFLGILDYCDYDENIRTIKESKRKLVAISWLIEQIKQLSPIDPQFLIKHYNWIYGQMKFLIINLINS